MTPLHKLIENEECKSDNENKSEQPNKKLIESPVSMLVRKRPIIEIMKTFFLNICSNKKLQCV